MSARLVSLEGLRLSVATPRYDRSACGTGIVHIGLGAFHKAHQAAYTDDALAKQGGDWRIAAVNLRSTGSVDALSAQNGLYTLIERGVDGDRARVIGSLSAALSLPRSRDGVMAFLSAPATAIVSVTVTEKGYGLDRATGGADPAHPAIAADLKSPERPVGLAGLLVHALKARRAAGTAPFTVLSCDNLAGNGEALRGLLEDFAGRAVPDMAEFIQRNVAFPSTMVDRITPAPGERTRSLARSLTGLRDKAAVETEAFSQWVIEDVFPTGRPAWDAGGAVFTDNAKPFETMKLRMLNGTHSLIAYAGFLCGHTYVRDAMGDVPLATLVRRHFSSAAATIASPGGIDLGAYAEALTRRFQNPSVAHKTYQIAMDGSQKMPHRVFAPAADALQKGADLSAFAFATAAWLRYTIGRTDDGTRYPLRDPLEAQLSHGRTAEEKFDHIASIPGLMPASLVAAPPWREAVTARLARMLTASVKAAVALEAAETPVP